MTVEMLMLLLEKVDQRTLVRVVCEDEELRPGAPFITMVHPPIGLPYVAINVLREEK